MGPSYEYAESESINFSKLSKMKWRYIHKRFRTPFYMFMLFDGASKHYNSSFKFPYELTMLALDSELMIFQDDWNNGVKLAMKEIKKNNKFCLDFTKLAYKQNNETIKFINLINKSKFEKFSDNKLAEILRTYSSKSINISAFMLPPMFFESELESNILSAVRSKLGSKSEEIMHVLTTLIKQTAVQEAEKDLLELAILKIGGKNVDKRVKIHQKKFGWLKNVSFDGHFYSLEEVNEKITFAMKDNPKEKLSHINEEHKKQIQLFKKYRGAFSKDLRIVGFIDSLNELIFFRTWRTETFYKNAQLFENFFEVVAKRIGLKSSKDLFYLTHIEIHNFLENNVRAPIELVESRKTGYFVFGTKTKTFIGEGELLAKVKNNTRFQDLAQVTSIIKGQVAYPGIVRGIACIVNSKADFSKVVSKEQILVTFSTTPDHVPLIKRVSAVVTDEGGVLSHASVISRELKIPCLIGTKIASKVIKDGQKIEVDARNGFVKII
jgi:phosphoenolpyruvate synthase/pyruvate phosphate dikinase